jgi:hypothetical protein
MLQVHRFFFFLENINCGIIPLLEILIQKLYISFNHSQGDKNDAAF